MQKVREVKKRDMRCGRENGQWLVFSIRGAAKISVFWTVHNNSSHDKEGNSTANAVFIGQLVISALIPIFVF